MKKLFSLIIYCLLGVTALNATDVTIYFANTSSWGTVKCYVWDVNKNAKVAWSGEAISQSNIYQKYSGTWYNLYSYTMDSKYVNVIFNNGSGTQTKDLKTKDGNYYVAGDAASSTGHTFEVVKTISISSEDTNKGTVNYSTRYAGYTSNSDKFKATAKSGYQFLRWELTGCAPASGYTVSSAEISVVAEENETAATAVAKFATPPTVTTGEELTGRSTTDVTISGSSYTGGTNVSDVGYVYGTSSSPTGNVTSCGGKEFTSITLSGLTANKTYYYRAYVKDDCGTTYGSNKSFSTGYRCYDGTEYMYFDVSACTWFLNDGCVPSVSFGGNTNYIDATVEDATKKIYKVVVPAGCYSSMYVSRHNSVSRYNDYSCTLQNVSTHNKFIVDSSWTGKFTWGDYNPCAAPKVTTGTTLTGLSSTGVTISGSTYEDGEDVTEVGYVYGTSSNPTGNETKCSEKTEFTDVTLTGLTANKTYHYRAYVKNKCGTTYGSDKTFTTYKAGPDNLYIKGPLYYGSWSGNYTQPDGYSKSGNVYTFPFNATNAEPSYGENRWFVIATSTASGSGETKIQNLMEGEQVGWSFETKDANKTFVADENIVTSTSTPITITVTYNEATEKYSMKVEPDCTEPTAQEVTIGAAEICSTGSTTISLGGSQSGYTYELYRDEVTTGKTVECTGEAVSFTEISAAGTYSVKGYQSNLATCISDMSNTVTLSTIPDMALTSITLSKDAECVGKTLTITPNGYNAGGSGSITYSSTDTSVATVDNTTATVTVVGAGSTTIKANVTGGCGSDIEKTANLSGAGVAISGPSPSPIHEYEPTTFTASATAPGRFLLQVMRHTY